ncbi:MAG TPA: aminotransferase class V-fold PLP-dependent enzyme [Actinomycetes bacterium]|nr:aminotransferase class V-fold PLP-dependent enzyme [Actinomycetes bacterium]
MSSTATSGRTTDSSGTGSRGGTDAARTVGLAEALALVVPALEAHLAAPATGTSAGAGAAWRAALDQPVPQQGTGAEATLRTLAGTVLPDAMRMTSPGFWGWITTGSTVVPAVARLATTFAGTQRYLGHTGNLLEEVSLRWLAETCGLPAGVQGVYSSSGSVANLLAMGAARQHAYERLGHDPARDGMTGLPAGRIYGSAEMHHCMLKSAGLLGLGRSAVTLVPVDDQDQVDVAALRAAVEADVAAGVVPVAVVAVAGTTNTGAIDDIAALADVAEQHGVWLHVDGAYGLFGRLDPRVADRYAGVERAHSWVVDAHKWLTVPTGVGATFVRDSGVLGRAFTGEPSDYIEGAFDPVTDVESPWAAMGLPYHDWSVDLSAPSRGMVVWAALQEIGVEGMRDRVVRNIDQARRVAEQVRAHPSLELSSEPVLSICSFRYVRDGLDEAALDSLNRVLVRRLHVETPYVPSPTLVRGRYVVRPCFINPRSTDDDVDAMVAAVVRIGDELVS